MTDYSYAAIPLYLAQIKSGQLKLGINISLNNSPTKMLYEFDTGAAGFYPAAVITGTNSNNSTNSVNWWPNFAENTEISNFTQAYSSGIQYTALSTPASLSFEGNVYGADSASPVSWPAVTVSVGAIIAATNTKQTPNAEGYTQFTIEWNNSLAAANADPSKPGPLDGVFYGDFGIGLGNARNSAMGEGPAVMAVFPQLPAPLSDVFTIVTKGTPSAEDLKKIEDNGPIPWGYVFLGTPPASVLQAAGVPQNFVLTTMVPNAAPAPFPNNPTLTSFAQGAVNALSCSFTPPSGSAIDVGNVNLVLDTGCPGIVVHYDAVSSSTTESLNGHDISGIVSGTDIETGVVFDLVITPDMPFGGQPSVGYHRTVSADKSISTMQNGNSNAAEQAGYINTGFDLFLTNAVQFNLATGQIGFAALG